MGGRPKVYGGMSAAEYNDMLNKQAQIAAEGERERQKNLQIYESERRAAEREQLRLQKEAERLAIVSQRAAEEEVAKEIQSKSDKPTGSSLSKKEAEQLQSMFGALYSGTLDPYLQKPQG